ncbi:putative GABA transporter [Tricladium varicosporioides]|nr:putative GABA transporter [Hymenoscyphus varicosporioides]
MAKSFELKDFEIQEGPSPTQNGMETKRSVIEQDNAILARLGKKPVLKRNFGFMSMLGFSCSIMATWEGVLILFVVSFVNGGFAGSIYGFLIVWLGNLAVFSTMGELASMAPTSGGQYHWVSMLAPKPIQKFLSYIIGWVTVIGWLSNVASGSFFCSGLIQGLIGMNNMNYKPQPWQAILLFYAVVIFAVFVNTVVSRALPKIEGLILIFHLLGFFAILIPLVYMAPHGSSTDVFTSFLNTGGFKTQGLSTLVGIVRPVFSFLGADSAVHMSEEIQNASIIVPRAMLLSIMINGILGFSMLIATLFCLGNVEEILQYPFPFMAIFQQAVGSIGGATTMASVATILTIFALISFVASASRMLWSFARDRGVPGWYTVSKVHRSTSIPMISITLVSIIACLLALISLGSTVAFNDVVSLTVSSLYISYLTGNGLLLWRRINGSIKAYDNSSDGLTNVAGAECLSWGPWKIPEPFGTVVNAFGCLYLIVVMFFSFWPTMMQPDAMHMNYSSLMLGSVVIFAVAYYAFRAKNVYKGPIVEI